MSNRRAGTSRSKIRRAGELDASSSGTSIGIAGAHVLHTTGETIDETALGATVDYVVPFGMHTPSTASPGGSAVPPFSGMLVAIPHFVEQQMQLRDVIQRQFSASGTPGKGHFALYSNTSAGIYPNARLWTSGELTFNGNQRYVVSVGQTFTVGWYWFVSIFDAGMLSNAVAIYGVNDAVFPVLGTLSSLTDTGTYTGAWRIAQAYGAPPATFPATGATRIARGGGFVWPSAFGRWLSA